MLTDKMQQAINEQINAELWSAYLYLSMSLDAESKALKGVANWFFVQWLEEQDHARVFQNYMNAQGAKVELEPIDPVPTEWESVLEMFRLTLHHETEVTAMIERLMNLAHTQQDYATVSRLQWFVDEQVEEEANAREMISAFAHCDDETATCILDHYLSKRKYCRCPPLCTPHD